MACDHFAVRRDGLEIKKAAENRNTVSIQLRTADEVWSYSLVVGRGANNSSLSELNM